MADCLSKLVSGGCPAWTCVELRARGIGSAALAFTLGAVHALTPGHGKAALTAYFLGKEARIGKGLHVALAAALLHALSGLILFVILRLAVGRAVSITGRPSPAFLMVGYGLIVFSGVVMLVQSLRPMHSKDSGLYALTGGVKLLPCPLTISILGFAWAQGTMAMVGLVLCSLAFGIAATIGLVAVLAIVGNARGYLWRLQICPLRAIGFGEPRGMVRENGGQ